MKLTIFNFLTDYLYIIVFIGLGILIYALRNDENAGGKFIGILVILSGVVIFWGIGDGISDYENNKRARDKVRKIIGRSDLTITVDGKLLDTVKTKEMATALMTITNIDAHHSSPIDIRPIQIISLKDTLNLRIGQDSNDSTEYWIFADEKISSEIGRLRTLIDIKKYL